MDRTIHDKLAHSLLPISIRIKLTCAAVRTIIPAGKYNASFFLLKFAYSIWKKLDWTGLDWTGLWTAL